ncbi:hypothetical protein [Streptomyces mirabilis]|uniref:hypothetical protein n=1 Tax=Streptomyces mirabilis TaxID=68239 RepID=UPI003D9E6F62
MAGFRRAGRTAPVQALGEASVDTGAMIRGRRLSGLVLLAGATRWQVLRLVGAEALTVVAVGGVPGVPRRGAQPAGHVERPGSAVGPDHDRDPLDGRRCGPRRLRGDGRRRVHAALALRRRAVELAGVRE